ncbi:alpha/beta fold hydrolase [Hyphomonas johnsonii]|uniref:Putative hydrolase n=1 Tax=Hyphomonas johnsonii MHS-2 TaxID=1280950 RepID=A0A059FPE6_9PROT|nr:alpha/beta fold hydrolase [Hyphomonas johnsonii]KCZ92406.1 putative hydrolase [Hyphomonas johnsonii MHS-2]
MLRWSILGVLALVFLVTGFVLMTYHDLPGATAREPVGERQDLDAGGAHIVTFHLGDGPEIVMFASAGREASDFNELAGTLAAVGYSVTLFEAPGINGATASAAEPSLDDLADDAGRYLATREAPVVVLGHAFGNRLARAVAARHPERVRGVILLAAGGLIPIEPEAALALRNSFDPKLTRAEREAAVRYGFFAEGNPVPDHWMRGWHAATGQMQGAATRATDSATWWDGGGKPMLVIAGLQDTIAPPADTIDLLEAAYPDQVTAVRIDGAGHALLPELPERVSGTVIAWLAGL